MTTSRDAVEIVANGRTVRAPVGSTVAAALMNAGVATFRRSVTNEARGPLCGMGVCFECRVTIDGLGQRRACLVTVAAGMNVVTDS